MLPKGHPMAASIFGGGFEQQPVAGEPKPAMRGKTKSYPYTAK
jgi:hypothetical protein